MKIKTIKSKKSKHKVIPTHFQKKRKPTLSQILKIASYQRRNRELSRNNKVLAKALEEAQCIASSQYTMLQNQAGEVNQILLARLKVKDMAITIQKLVEDLNSVIEYLDLGSIKTLNRPFENVQLAQTSRPPDLDVIDESLTSSEIVENSSIIEQNCAQSESSLTKADSSFTEVYNVQQFLTISNLQKDKAPSEISENSSTLEQNIGQSESSSTNADSSFTEVYNVQQLMTMSNAQKDKDSQPKETVQTSKEIQSPHTPELDLSAYNTKRKILYPGMCSFPLGINKLDIFSAPRKSPQTIASKIPLRRPSLLEESHCSHLPINQENQCGTLPGQLIGVNLENFPETSVTSRNSICLNSDNHQKTFSMPKKSISVDLDDRRKTFVVQKSPLKIYPENRRETYFVCKNNNSDRSRQSSSRRETLTLNEILREKTPAKNVERCGTFIVPQLPPLPRFQPQKSSTIYSHSAGDICPDEGTVHLSEDMELTDIIPSLSSSRMANEIFSQTSVINSCVNFTDKSKEPLKTCFSKPTVIDKQISPIQKLNARMEEKRTCESLSTIIPESSSLKNTVSQIMQETVNVESQVSSTVATTSPVQSGQNPRSDDLPNCKPSSSDPENSCNIQSSKQHNVDSDGCSILQSENLENDHLALSSAKKLQRLSRHRKSILPIQSGQFFENIPTDLLDCDDFVEAPALPSKRVSSRKSLKQNSKRLFESTNRSESSSHNNKTEESDKINIGQPLTNENLYEFSSPNNDDQSSKKAKLIKITTKKLNTKNGKVKNTVAILEQDINLIYQEQSRRKKSMKRKVSFANINTSPEDYNDEMNNAENCFGTKVLEPLLIDSVLDNAKAPGPRRSILKKTKSFLNDYDKRYSLSPNVNDIDNKETDESKKSDVKSLAENLIEIPKENHENNVNLEEIDKAKEYDVRSPPNNLMEILKENHTEDHFEEIVSMAQNSELPEFGNKVSLINVNKRTFSGVSERASKKRITDTDDFLEDIVIDFPETENIIVMPESAEENKESENNLPNFIQTEENKALPTSVKKNCSPLHSVSTEKPASVLDSVSNKEYDAEANLNVDKSPKPSKKKSNCVSQKKAKKSNKSKKSTNENQASSIELLTDNKQIKGRKTSKFSNSRTSSIGSVDESKENVPDLESKTRSRRTKEVKSYKEPNLHMKMRRN